MNALSRKLTRSPLCFGLMVFGLLALGLFMAPGKAAAANGYGCGVSTGSRESMAGLIVDVKWIPYGGSAATARDDNNNPVVVTTDSPSSTKDASGQPANVAKMSADDSTELTTYHSVAFNQVNANCNGDGYVVTLGYGKTSPNTGGGYNYWALDCDISLHPDHYQSFAITGSGVPTGARAGGTWDVVHAAPPNGETTSVTIYYREPAPAPVNHAPTGSLTVACDSFTQGHATASFDDPDAATTAYITVSGVAQATTASSPHTWSGLPATSGGTPIALYVKDVGKGSSGTYKLVARATLTNARCNSGVTCPTFPTNPQTVTVSPENPPKDTVPSSGYGPRDNIQYRYVANNNYKMDSVTDQYGQSARGPDGSSGWTPTGETSNSNVFKIYYDGWIKDYPYDHHDITYYYETYYNRVHYQADGAPVYTCDGGRTTTSSSTCSSTYNPGCNAYDKAGNCTDPAACNSGDSGAYPTCTHTTDASLLGYTYKANGDVDKDNTHTRSDPTKAPQLPECYNRDFKVLPPSDTDVTNITLTPTDEDPSTVTIGTQTTVQFSLSHGGIGLRQPASVNGLGYTGTYTVKHADGTEDPFYVKATDDQSFTIGTANPTPSSPEDAPPYPYKPSYSVSVPPLQAGDEICAVFTIAPGSGEVDESGNQHNVSGSVDSTKKCSAPIVNQPYVQFYGGDVSAGGGINGISSCSDVAGIDTATQGPSPAKQPYAGSGVQFGALSIGPINGFVSANLRTSNPRLPTGLSFSNTSGAYGGSLGGQHCVPNYYATMPKAASGGPVSGSISQAYNLLGNQTIGGLSIADGANVTIYVKGNVYIGGNINFANTTWPSVDKVPSLFLIVVPDDSGNGGNIYIGPNVTHLDGVYVAQGSGSTHGVIDTCADGFSSYPASDIYRNCGPWSGNGYKDTQLMVNGAFIANHVRLHRAFSSLRHGRPGETPNGGGTHACDVEGGVAAAAKLDCAAEIFNFSPETYLGQPRMDQVGGSRLYKYDYLTSLSPVL